MEKKKVLEVKDYHLTFRNSERDIPIIHGLDFEIREGETLGVVGESGCGKTITALSVMGLLEGNAVQSGEILYQEKNILRLPPKELRKIRGEQISMIFQEPMTSLNPVLTIGTQLSEVFVTHQKKSKGEAKELSIEALKMVNIAEPEKRFHSYPHELSGGMRQRVMIAMALSCRPDLLIADEPTTALDVTIQAQILGLLAELKQALGTSVMLITHDLGVVAEVCSRAVIMYCGRIVEEASVADLFRDPRHPYTKGLLSALPRIGVRDKLAVIPGNVPSTGNYPKGCPFHTRCAHTMDICREELPPQIELGEGRRVCCFLEGGQ
jgi:oligopeptide/dipeptide ABC transporter ATP-binding protein